MKSYLFKRLALLLPTFFGITIITFFLVQLSPGDPASLKAQSVTEFLSSDEESVHVIAETKKLYGLDKPLLTQYFLWLKRVLLFDFGTSYRDHRPVLTKIYEALPVTLLLNVLTLFTIFVISFPLGMVHAMKPDTWHDRLSAVLLFFFSSLPVFWVAILLLVLFAGGDYLNLFPIIGFLSDEATSFPWYQRVFNVLWHLTLPVAAMSVVNLAFLSRFVRSSFLDVLQKEYIRTAFAKGLSPFGVMRKHALKNALLPLITLFGNLLPALFSGSLIIEQIFSLPGMGRLGFEAVLTRDYPVIMGITVISAFLMLLSYMMVDVVYLFLDPRLHFERNLR